MGGSLYDYLVAARRAQAGDDNALAPYRATFVAPPGPVAEAMERQLGGSPAAPPPAGPRRRPTSRAKAKAPGRAPQEPLL